MISSSFTELYFVFQYDISFVSVSLVCALGPADLSDVLWRGHGKYRKVSNIRRTKSQNLNASRLIL